MHRVSWISLIKKVNMTLWCETQSLLRDMGGYVHGSVVYDALDYNQVVFTFKQGLSHNGWTRDR